jgi:very-short-patch-repair endonuclease
MAYDYQTADPTLYPLLRVNARNNRNNPTEAEALLWEYLRAEGLGVNFKRQHIIGPYIADFVCLSSKLVIELDGAYHQLPEQQVSDEQRTEWLNQNGYRVLRFTNKELFNNIDEVLRKIEDSICAEL